MNERPLQGKDVSVMCIGPNGPALVGEYQGITVSLTHAVEKYLTLGSRVSQLLDGEISISGSLKRGHVSGTKVSEIMGSSYIGPGVKIPTPRFIIFATFDAPEKGIQGRYQLGAVVLDKFDWTANDSKSVVQADKTYQAETFLEVLQ